MKIFPLSIILLLFSVFIQPLFAQKKKSEKVGESFFLFKKDWSDAKNLDEASYFMQAVKENDSLYVCRYYNKLGPMIKQESYKDEDLSIPNGRFCWYNEKGELDSIGLVKDRKKDKYWEYYQNGKRIKAANYNAGKLLNTTDYVKNIYITADGNEIPLKEKEANDSMANSSGKKVVQVEAEFKNGKKGWQYYLERNLRIPDRLKNVLGQGAYKVVCGFFVNKTGGVEDIYVAESREWSADTEVLRIIKNSPLWVPAQEDGKPVYYHARQAVTLVIN